MKDRLHRTRGFTLIELTVVLVIIVVLATAAVPQILSRPPGLALERATEATMAIFREARSRAANDFSATGVQVTWGPDMSGVLSLHSSPSNQPGCESINWGAAIRTLDIASNPSFGEGSSFRGSNVRVVQVTPASVQRVCMAPDGRTVQGTTPFLPIDSEADSNYAAGELIISLAAHAGEERTGLVHHVLVPYSGHPRWTWSTDPDVSTAQGEGAL